MQLGIDVLSEDDVGDGKPPAGFQDAKSLSKRGVLVGAEIYDAIGDHGIREATLKPCRRYICDAEFDACVLQPCFSHGLLRTFHHLRRTIYSDHPPPRPDSAGSQDHVYPAAASQIDNHITGLKVRESGRVTTPAREVKSELREEATFVLTVEPLTNRVARTGLLLAGSTGCLATPCLGEPAVATLGCALDLFDFHHFYLVEA